MCIYIYIHIYIYIYLYILLRKITATTQMIKMIIAIAMKVSDHTALKKYYLLYVSFT